MLASRFAEADVHAALRRSGVGRIGEAELVVLEADGQFSVVKAQKDRTADVVSGIKDQIEDAASEFNLSDLSDS